MNQEYVIAHADTTEKFWSRGRGWTTLDKAAKFGGVGDAESEIESLTLNGHVALWSDTDEGDLNDD